MSVKVAFRFEAQLRYNRRHKYPRRLSTGKGQPVTKWYQRHNDRHAPVGRRGRVPALLWPALLLLLIAFGGRWLLFSLSDLLVIDQEPVSADAIVVLGGGSGSREERAVNLYDQGLAPVLIASGETLPILGRTRSYAQMAADYMVEQGVPRDAILLMDTVTSTYDEAVATLDLCEQRGWRSLIVVTDAYHTGRSRLVFRKVYRASDIKLTFVAAEPPWFDRQRWWADERSLLAVLQEYVKLVLYLLKGYIV